MIYPQLHDYFAGKAVLVTGGFGFIGSNLVRKLLQLGANVTILDNLEPDSGGNLFNLSDCQLQRHRNFNSNSFADISLNRLILSKYKFSKAFFMGLN